MSGGLGGVVAGYGLQHRDERGVTGGERRGKGSRQPSDRNLSRPPELTSAAKCVIIVSGPEHDHGARSRITITERRHGTRRTITDHDHRARSRSTITDHVHGTKTRNTEHDHGSRSRNGDTEHGSPHNTPTTATTEQYMVKLTPVL